MMFVQNQQPVKPQPQAWEDVTVLAYPTRQPLQTCLTTNLGQIHNLLMEVPETGSASYVCRYFLTKGDHPTSLRVVPLDRPGFAPLPIYVLCAIFNFNFEYL